MMDPRPFAATWHNYCITMSAAPRCWSRRDTGDRTDTGRVMSRCVQAGLICAIALVAGRAIAADPPAGAQSFAPRPNALGAPVATTAAPRTRSAVHPVPPPGTILSPKGFAAEEIPAYDDFLHKTIATKRLELLRFVDREDRRVFLGLTRDGFGIHVQQRDRR